VSAHRVVIEFDDGVRAKLVCPESGCMPAQNCAQCGRDLRPRDEAEQQAEGIEPCYDCKDAESWRDECWIKTWFDNIDATELLAGKVTVEIDAEWDLDHMVAHIIETEPSAGEAGTGVSADRTLTGVIAERQRERNRLHRLAGALRRVLDDQRAETGVDEWDESDFRCYAYNAAEAVLERGIHGDARLDECLDQADPEAL